MLNIQKQIRFKIRMASQAIDCDAPEAVYSDFSAADLNPALSLSLSNDPDRYKANKYHISKM